METILYTYKINISDFLFDGIPFIIGLGCLLYAISHVISAVRKKTDHDEKGFVPTVFTVLGFIIGSILILLCIAAAQETIETHKTYKEMLANDDLSVVAGYVENYHAMPASGHDTEHFDINGIYFEYSNYEVTLGYHDAASLGGVVTHDGQHLKIKYYESDYYPDYEVEFDENYKGMMIDEKGNLFFRENVILYIAEIEDY